MEFYNTLVPYKTLDYKGIQYASCRDFNHISRYRGLRQVIHSPNEPDRLVTLETSNPFTTSTNVNYYEVSADTENRLDVIAYRFLGSAQYAWVIAYFNGIEDGFTCREGQRLVIPKSISSLFNTGEILQAIPASTLNLGSE